VHARELEELASQAKSATASGQIARAREAWERALTLLPPGTVQHSGVRARIDELAAKMNESPPAKKSGLASAGVLGVLALALSKGKFLLTGLTKLSTLTSMLAAIGVYWALFGWKFALGFVLSIYVHEMGHVAALRHYGIPATAPMFIPGLGAFVRMKAYPANVIEDARVGLAGPLWGLGAAIVCAGMFFVTQHGLWAALARTGAWINLFNLIPIWQLDGGRGFRALTRNHRFLVLLVAAALWVVTQEGMLLLICFGAIYRLFTKDYPERGDTMTLAQFAGLLAALAAVYQISPPPPR
jgi:Zn-dependent protease